MQSQTNSCESSNNRASSNVGALLALNQPENAYQCPRCSRGFPSSQSLGGHQNAHRKERNAERRQIMEERKMLLERIKRTEMNMLSPQPLKAVPLAAITCNLEHQSQRPHFAISHNNLGPEFKDFMDYQAQMGSLPTSHPGSSSAPMAFANYNGGAQYPHGVVSMGNYNYQNNNPTTLYNKLKPWELNLYPNNSNSNEQEETHVEEDESVGSYSMKGKKEKRDKVTWKEDLDLDLDLKL